MTPPEFTRPAERADSDMNHVVGDRTAYDVNAAKREAKRARRGKVKALRQEGLTDEDGEAVVQGLDRNISRRLLRYLRPYRRTTAGAIALLLLYSAVVPVFPYLITLAIDNYLNPVREPFIGLSPEARYRGLVYIALAYAGLRAANFGLRFGYTYLVNWLGQRVIFDIRREIFSKVQRLHLGYFDRTPVGRLITRVTSDIEAIQQAVVEGVVGIIADVGLLIGLTIYMFVINWQLALVTLLVMPFLYVTLNFLRARIRDAFRAVRLRTSRSNAYLSENLSGMKTVQLFNREARNARRFDQINLDLLDAYVEQIRWFSLFFPAVQLFGALSTALILFYGAVLLVGDSVGGVGSVITIGLLTAFLQYSGDFFRPIQNLSDRFNTLQAAMASAERIFGLLDTPEEVNDPPEPATFAGGFRGEVAFDNVSFAYGDEEWVLRDLSFTIRPGESVAFVGHTGAGKTTVISLVSRFYDVQRGTVRIDGRDVRDYAQIDLRRHVGIVLQDPFLFSGTVRSNITLNDPNISLERVVEAAKFVNAHGFIERLPGGYDTPVRERGAGFSTGQKQLIAFARALVQNPDILLVLDEATANVDTETEELIQDALGKLMQGRTSIVIAHRLSTIQNVDRIMVMKKGRLLESGSHAELLTAEGYYRTLYELQYQGQSQDRSTPRPAGPDRVAEPRTP